MQSLSTNSEAMGKSTKEDPVPTEEGDIQTQGAGKTPEQLQDLIMLVRQHLPEIEEMLQTAGPQSWPSFLADDRELPEDVSDPILEMLDGWSDGFPEMLAGLEPDTAIMVAQQCADQIQELDPILVAAWLWRAGELASLGGEN